MFLVIVVKNRTKDMLNRNLKLFECMARRDFGDAFRPKAPLYRELFSEIFPGGEERNPSFSRLNISAISPGLPAGQLCITAVPGVKSTKCAT